MQSAADSAPDGRNAAAIALDNGQSPQSLLVFSAGFVIVKPIASHGAGFGDRLGGVGHVETARAATVKDGAGLTHPQILEFSGGGAGGLAGDLEAELLLPPQAHYQDTRCLHLLPRVQQQRLVSLSGEITAVDGGTDEAAGRPVHRGSSAAGPHALKEVDDDGFARPLLNFSLLYCNIYDSHRHNGILLP